MRQVQLHEEEQQFAALVSEAEAGESLTILRHGKPVAQIIPFTKMNEPVAAERSAALARLSSLMEKGYDMGLVWNGRDELYDRDE
jgi:prevent-host-death family protein